MKIAHISDLHLDMNYKQANLNNTKKLLGFIKDEKFDHVVITGDITENAEPSAFELARKLFQKFDLLSSVKLTLIIGNHDIYGGVHLAEDVLNYPAKCKAVNCNKQVEQFEYYFRECFDNCSKLIDGSLFPFVKSLDEFIFIGLNSIAKYSVLKNPFASNGKISAVQIEKLGLLDEISAYKDKKRILLTHHHFCKNSLDLSADTGTIWQAVERQTMKLRSKKKVIRKLRNSAIDMVLHGHLHETTEYKRKGIRFVNAGGSVIPGSNGLLSFNELIITKDTVSRRIRNIESSSVDKIRDYPNPQLFNRSPKISFSKEICLN